MNVPDGIVKSKLLNNFENRELLPNSPHNNDIIKYLKDIGYENYTDKDFA